MAQLRAVRQYVQDHYTGAFDIVLRGSTIVVGVDSNQIEAVTRAHLPALQQLGGPKQVVISQRADVTSAVLFTKDLRADMEKARAANGGVSGVGYSG